MKKLLVLTMVLAFSTVMMAQKGATKYFETLNNKGYTEVEWTYITQMHTAAKSLDACSRSKNNCSLEDPIKNPKAKAIKQASLGWSFGVEREVMVQQHMAAFEKVIYSNKKNKLLPWIIIESAFIKYPGYSYGAMSSRMSDYIQHMESVDDDE